ncbi:MAG: hypothetical protein OXT67_08145 [Zetaproteobacteria bacterium]|nr:hypothetical protein [Zetaproteobacteria bacterium]
MEFHWVDLCIGLFIANAIPHFIVGVMDIRFLCLFGFGAKQNILYSAWNIAWSLGLAWYFHGFEWITHNGLYLGVCLILASYIIGGRFLYERWR